MPVRFAALVTTFVALAATSASASRSTILPDHARTLTRHPIVTATIASAESAVQALSRDTSGEPSLQAMIGQMIVIGFAGTRADEEAPARVIKLIHDGRIGGVVLYDYNIVGRRQLEALNAALTEAGGALRPFICIDQEGGWIQRLTRAKGFVGLPAAARKPGISLDKA